MRIVRIFPVLLALILPGLVSLPLVSGAQKKTSASTKKKAPTKKTASKSAKGKSSTASAKRKSKSRRRVARSSGQRQPEPDRIKEIQEALASRGFDVEPTGVWDARSVAAVRQFQEANKISNFTGKGKLDSLTLIALGLGPNHGTQPAQPKTNTEGQQP